MNCEAVRQILPERALGVVRDLGVERHLRTCAACRQEANGLDRAAVTIGFALSPQDASPDLEGRIVGAIREAARPRATGRTPRRRTLVALLAAALAMGAVWGGTVFAAREGVLDPAIEAQRQKDEFADFLAFMAQNELGGDSTAMLGVLADPSGGPGRGSAMALVGDRGEDRILVMANGLVATDASLPFSVRVADGNGRYVWVGAVERLTPTGGFTVARIVDLDLEGFVNVTVRDVRGRVVLTGALAEQASLPSQSG